MKWNNINIFPPPENKLILVCYREANRNKVGVTYWVPVGYKKIWIGSIRRKNISHWTSIDNAADFVFKMFLLVYFETDHCMKNLAVLRVIDVSEDDLLTNK